MPPNPPRSAPPARALARVGTMLCGRYRVERLIGLGGMGAVYAGTHRNGLAVAIKILHDRPTLDDALERALRREARLANEIRHPGVVPVLDDDIAEDGALFLVMPLLEGETLQARWEARGRTLPLGETLAIGAAVLDALAAAHAKRVVHRDIKPANVFLPSDGGVRVIDFGVARFFETDDPEMATRSGRAVGTPAFMAPEQALGRTNEIDGRTDLWAVGAMLFTLLSQRLVHGAPTPAEIIVRAATRPAPPLRSVAPHVPLDVCAVVDRALEFRREDRWPDAAAMAEALRVTSGEGVRASVEAAFQRGSDDVGMVPAAATEPLLSLDSFRREETRSQDAPQVEEPARARSRSVSPWLRFFTTAGAPRARMRRDRVLFGVLVVLLPFAGYVGWDMVREARIPKVQFSDAFPPSELPDRPITPEAVASIAPLWKVRAHRGSVQSLAMSADGAVVLSGGGEGGVNLWSAKDGAAIASLGSHDAPARCVGLSRDGRRGVSAGGKNVIAWDIDARRPLRTLDVSPRKVGCAGIAPDGSEVLFADTEGDVTVWNLETGASRRIASAPREHFPRALAISPDGRSVAVAGNVPTIHVWSIATGALEATLSGHRHGVTSLAFTPGGESLVSGSGDGTTKLWTVRGGVLQLSSAGADRAVMAVAASSAGDSYAAAARDGVIRVYSRATGLQTLAFQSAGTRRIETYGLVFAPRGDVLLGAQSDTSLAAWPLPRPSTAQVPKIGNLREIPTASRSAAEACARGATLLDLWNGDAATLDEVERLATIATDGSCADILRARAALDRGFDGVERFSPASIDAALRLLDHARSVAGPSSAERVARAWALHARADDAGAKREALDAEVVDPDGAAPHALLATLAAARSDADEAVRQATLALSGTPSRGEASQALAALESAYSARGDYASAGAAYDAELGVSKGSFGSRRRYIRFLDATEQRERAMELGRQAVADYGTQAAREVLSEVYFTTGVGMLWDRLPSDGVGQPKKAFDRAIEQDPKNAVAYYGLGALWRYVAVSQRDRAAVGKARDAVGRSKELGYEPAAGALEELRGIDAWLGAKP